MTLQFPSPPSGGRRLAAIDPADLLLILILSLGGARLLGLIVGMSASPALPDQEPGSPAVVVITLFILQNMILLAAIYTVAIRGCGVAWSDLGLRPASVPWRRRAILATLAAFPLVGLVNALVASLIGQLPNNPQLQVIAPTGVSLGGAIGMILTLGVIVPIAEELLFRGLLYGWLRDRLGIQPAMVISALCFSLLHGIIWLIPAVAMLGLILAWVYEKSDSLWASITTHGLFNTISTTFLYVALQSGVLPS